MARLLLTLLVLIAPGLAAAAHNTASFRAAYDLDLKAADFEYDVSRLPANKRLKQEARRFRKTSARLVRRADRTQRGKAVRKSIYKLDKRLMNLRAAVVHSELPWRLKRRLNHRLEHMALALERVEYASSRRHGYAQRAPRYDGLHTRLQARGEWRAERWRRYRSQPR